MKNGRPSKWKGKTTAIRVPEVYADRLLDLARWWDSGGHTYAPEPLTADGVQRMAEHLKHYGREALIQEIIAFRTDQDALWARISRGETV